MKSSREILKRFECTICHTSLAAKSSARPLFTFCVVQDTLNEDWVLGDALCDQQDAFLDAMATQQGSPANPL